jgi:hypothetical protein
VTDPSHQEEFDLDSRVPCEDGACIGVIGQDGRCGTCQKTYTGKGAAKLSPGDAPASALRLPDDSVDESDEVPLERVLCSDDACIGIIGQDGTCGTCGRRF